MVASKTPSVFTPEQQALWHRLEDFALDRDDVALSFSQRLMQDNGWTVEFAKEAIAEYKKFVFLAIEAGHPVTPSDAVDQVWHLHLSYSRSYWEDFCPNVLQKSLYHEPTQGGQAESEKFEDWYSQTLETYEQFFGKAPQNIWPTTEVRFGRDLAFRRINIANNFVFAKSQVWKIGAIAIVIFLELIASTIYLAQPEHCLSFPKMLGVGLIGGGLSYGAVMFVSGLILAIKRRHEPNYGGCSGGLEFGCGGCGYGGCGGS